MLQTRRRVRGFLSSDHPGLSLSGLTPLLFFCILFLSLCVTPTISFAHIVRRGEADRGGDNLSTPPFRIVTAEQAASEGIRCPVAVSQQGEKEEEKAINSTTVNRILWHSLHLNISMCIRAVSEKDVEGGGVFDKEKHKEEGLVASMTSNNQQRDTMMTLFIPHSFFAAGDEIVAEKAMADTVRFALEKWRKDKNEGESYNGDDMEDEEWVKVESEVATTVKSVLRDSIRQYSVDADFPFCLFCALAATVGIPIAVNLGTYTLFQQYYCLPNQISKEDCLDYSIAVGLAVSMVLVIKAYIACGLLDHCSPSSATVEGFTEEYNRHTPHVPASSS